MSYKRLSTLSLGLSLSLGLILTPIIHSSPTLAHNTILEYQATEAIAINAKFDNGQPMKNAQVVIYAPDNPTVPWSKGSTDEAGKFTFIPDYQKTGNWTVKIRLAGHGSVINIPIENTAIPIESSSSINSENLTSNQKTIVDRNDNSKTLTSAMIQNNQNSNLSWSQKLLMSIVGAWGFIGTALYFSGKNSKNNKTINN